MTAATGNTCTVTQHRSNSNTCRMTQTGPSRLTDRTSHYTATVFMSSCVHVQRACDSAWGLGLLAPSQPHVPPKKLACESDPLLSEKHPAVHAANEEFLSHLYAMLSQSTGREMDSERLLVGKSGGQLPDTTKSLSWWTTRVSSPIVVIHSAESYFTCLIGR